MNIMTTGKMWFKTYGAEFKLGVGVAFIFGGLISAFKADKEQIDEAKEEIGFLHENKERIQFEESEGVYNGQLVRAYRKLAVELVKANGPAIFQTCVGTGLVMSAHADVRKEAIAYGGLALSLSKQVRDMEKRIEEEYGKDAATRIRYGLDTEEVEVSDENGEVQKETVTIGKPNWYDDSYMVKIEKGCRGYILNKPLREAERMSLQDWVNNRIDVRQSEMPTKVGFCWLNEALDEAHFRLVECGQNIGWICDPKHPDQSEYCIIEEITINGELYWVFKNVTPIMDRIFR